MSGPIHGKGDDNDGTQQVAVTSNGLHVNSYVWDVDTLSWVRDIGAEGAGGGGTGSTVEVTNFPAVQTITGTISSTVYAKRYNQVSDTIAYLGEAAAGSAASSGVWRIQRLTFSAGGDVDVEWAGGSSAFSNVWNNRASLSYS